ncbi:helix-turn-helix domain-containing protein [Pseudomonas sp. R2.Fl]|nr:helix-turn-helix domain-containing protein [Pseudomonas sp. R2.Fl]
MSNKPPSEPLRRLGLSPQFIQLPGGGRLVVLPEAQYHTLEQMAVAHLRPRETQSEEHYLPHEIRQRILAGENPVRAIRKWRGMTGKQLASLVEITPSMMSQIERTGKTGSTRTFQKIAMVLGVPLEEVVPHVDQ